MDSKSSENLERMQCMEVWGGNQFTDKSLSTAGLDIWVYSRPHGESQAGGGDVYYLSSCASGRITRLLVADVSGHGDAVADMATYLRDLMRQNINYINQRRFVQAMNQQFLMNSRSNRFATAIVSTFFAPTQSLALSNAGHPQPLVYRASRKKWDVLELKPESETAANNIPLGIIEETDYQELTTRLAVGDMLLCFTDSFTESFDKDGSMLWIDGLLDIVQTLEVTQPEQLARDLIQRLESMHQENLDNDDATLLLLRANGTGATLRDNLLSPFRLVADVFRRS